MNPGAIYVQWHDHPTRVPAAAWDLPGAGDACLSLPYLRALHDGALPFVERSCYATAHQGDTLVGLLVGFLLEVTEEEALGPGPFRVFTLSDAMGMCRPPLVVAGPTPDARRQVFDALIEASIDLARQELTQGVHFYWIGEGVIELRAALAAFGFVAMPDDTCAHVPLLAGELGAYPAPMRSNYRNVVRRKRQQLEAHGIVVRSPEFPPDIAALHGLYVQVAERKEDARRDFVESRFTPRFFELALEHSAFCVYTCERRDGELLGYLLALRSGDTFVSLIVGLDYEGAVESGVPGLVAAVYQVLHVEALAQAQAGGARWAMLGISALEGKARLGALCERNHSMGLGLTERAREALDRARAAAPLDDGVPACRPYPEVALEQIHAEAARRSIRLVDPATEVNEGT